MRFIMILFFINIIKDYKNVEEYKARLLKVLVKTHRQIDSLRQENSSPLLLDYPYSFENFSSPESKLIPKKIWNDPEIWKFTKGVANEYFETALFRGLNRVAAAEFEYKILIRDWTGGWRYKPMRGKVIMFSDIQLSRLIWHVKGSRAILAYGEYGKGVGKFKYPQGIEIVFPHVFVADPGNRRVVHLKFKLLPEGSLAHGYPYALEWVGVIEKRNGKNLFAPFSPSDIAYSNNGTPDDSTDDLIYVGSINDNFILKFRFNDLELLGQIGFYEELFDDIQYYPFIPSIYGPVSIAIGQNQGKHTNEIYATGYFKNEIYRIIDSLDYNGRVRVKKLKLPGQPISIQTDYWGYVYVADKTNDKIIKIYPDLHDTIWTYGGHGFGVGKFNKIRDIYILGGQVVVTESWTDNSGISYFWIQGIFEDNTPPKAKILSPPDSTYINGEISVIGKVEDNIGIKGWTLSLIPYSNFQTSEFLNSGSGEILYDTLFLWNTDSFSQGLYYLILNAEDEYGNFASDTHLLYIGEPPPVLTISGKGKEPGKFRLPCDVTVDSEFIYIADSQNDRIQKFKKTGEFVWTIGKTGKNKGEFIQPDFISYFEGKIFVSDRNNSRVQVFDTKGNYLTEFGGKNLFNQTGGIAFDKDKNIYVSDIHNHRINVFDSLFNYKGSFGEYGDTLGKFNQPHGIFILDTLIYIVDRQNNRVQVFNLEGKFIKVMGEEGSERGKFSHPYDLVIDRDTSLYVSDQHNNRIQKFDKFGNVLLEIYGEKLNDSLKQPKGLSIDEKFLYVMDTYNNRLVLFPLKIGYGVDSLAKYNVKPGDMLVLYDKGKIYFILNIKGEGKEIKTFGGSGSGKGYVEIKIFDILGRRMGYLLKGFYPEGKMKVLLNKDLKTGVYFLKGEISGNRVRKKFIIFR